ncbi:hypothetical protein B0O80DRAFT_446950 [Mortierella sp. GBAus27b]|nr:hypothetical protein B0O80DRAFT_446950 [Mortierella sp. GBAus27b]
MHLTKDRPLLLSEIILHISRFVGLDDAITCAQVCKAWNNAFTSAVWHTIDLGQQHEFAQLDPAIIKKHGHRIRVIIAVDNDHHLRALHHSSVSNLRSLSIVMQGSTHYQAFCFDIIRRNVASLTRMHLWAHESGYGYIEAPKPVDVLTLMACGPAWKLSHLFIENLAITRDGFSALLQTCPALESLDVQLATLYPASYAGPYQHTRLTRLSAPLEHVFRLDSDGSSKALSILAHFPELRILQTWSSRTGIQVSFEKMRDEISQHCPLLKNLCTFTPAPITTTLLTRTFRSLTTITVSDDKWSTEVVMAILSHQRTLTTVSTVVSSDEYYEYEDVIDLRGRLPVPGWTIQLIPQTCSQLTKLELPTFELDMDDIEATQWSCTCLEELYIRIRGF